MTIDQTIITMLSYTSLSQKSVFSAFTGQMRVLVQKDVLRWGYPWKHCRPAQKAGAAFAQRTRSLGALLRTHVHCLRERCSQRSVPDSQQNHLRMRALREFPCKGASWLWLIPWFCNTYNMYVGGGHTEYIVPLPMFKYYFIQALDVVITVCIQSEIILVQCPRSRFKQKSRTWIQI